MPLTLSTHFTDSKEAQKRIREQGQLLRTMLDTTPDCVCLQDGNCVYLAANKAFCDLVGRKEKEIIGKTSAEIFPARLADKFCAEDKEIIRTGKKLVKESRIRRPNSIQWLHVVKVPVYDAEGHIMGLLCNSRDISELKQVQKKLVQAQKMETVGQLTAGIAHEINTPLGIILGYAQLLLEEAPQETQMYADLEVIERQTQTCRRIVADLLTFSRLTESRTGQVDLNRSIEAVVNVLAHTFSLDQVSIHRDFDKAVPPIRGDEERIKQVFVNLLNNARDAIGRSGTIRVVTRLDQPRGEIQVIVVDTGGGIAAENIDRIFDPFFTTKSADKGTGMGLSISYGIVREHHGVIEAESPPSEATRRLAGASAKGTAFRLRFPLAGSTTEGES